MFRTLTLSLTVLLALHGEATASPDISISSIPGGIAITRPMSGDYAQHSAAAQHLLAFVNGQPCHVAGFIFGEYPEDPGKVGIDNVHWTIGFQITDAKHGCDVRIASPYVRTTLTPVTAAVLTTTLSQSQDAGFALLRWLPDSGYVQDGPTRIEYRDSSGQPNAIIRMILPVKKRQWP